MSDTIQLAPDALVLLVGTAGSGKSTFAARHFAPGEVLSSDALRALVAGDPADQSASRAAFARLHATLELRLLAGQLTVVDATNVQAWARRRGIAAGLRHARPVVAIVLALPLEVALLRNAGRSAGRVPAAVVRRQDALLRRSLSELPREGVSAVHMLLTAEAVDTVVVRQAQKNVPKERRPAR